MKPATSTVCLLIAFALALAASSSALAIQDGDAKLSELSDEQLAEAIAQLKADDKLVAADERKIMTELGVSMPDGVVKNQLRRMNMKHILHLENLDRLQEELTRRNQPAAGA